MMLEGYPNVKKEVDGSIPAVKSPLVLWHWPIGPLSNKIKINELEKINNNNNNNNFLRNCGCEFERMPQSNLRPNYIGTSNGQT